MSANVVTNRLPWQDRWTEPSLEQLLEPMKLQHRRLFEQFMSEIADFDHVEQVIAWYGQAWNWTIQYQLMIPGQGPHTLAYMVPRVETPIICIPLSDAIIDQLPLKRLNRFVRDGIKAAKRAVAIHWATWTPNSKAEVGHLSDLLKRECKIMLSPLKEMTKEQESIESDQKASTTPDSEEDSEEDQADAQKPRKPRKPRKTVRTSRAKATAVDAGAVSKQGAPSRKSSRKSTQDNARVAKTGKTAKAASSGQSAPADKPGKHGQSGKAAKSVKSNPAVKVGKADKPGADKTGAKENKTRSSGSKTEKHRLGKTSSGQAKVATTARVSRNSRKKTSKPARSAARGASVSQASAKKQPAAKTTNPKSAARKSKAATASKSIAVVKKRTPADGKVPTGRKKR